jgi:general secretion pathway protein D
MMLGCAPVQHVKGLVDLAVDRQEEGIAALGSAAKGDPHNAEYRIDYLVKREAVTQELVSQADELRNAGNWDGAKSAYERVLRLDKANVRAARALATLPRDRRLDESMTQGEEFLRQGKTELALDRARQALEINPDNRRALKLREACLEALAVQELARAKTRAERAVLDSPVSLRFTDATVRQVFDALSKATGLNVLFDRDVKQNAPVTLFVKDVSATDVIELILMQNQLSKRSINANTVLIFPDNESKRAEYDELTIKSFQIANADIKYLSTMLKSMLRLKEVAADERTGIMVIRDTAERLRLAEKLIAVHDVADPEIMLEVQVLEVSRTRASNLGIDPPTTFGVTTPGKAGSLTLDDLKGLTRGNLLATPLSVTLNLMLQDADTKILASPRIRAKNREKAKIMIGDRVPTIVNTVTPVNTGSPVVTGSVSYQDVGLKLEFEPQVHGNSEVSIKINLEVSNIAQAFTDSQGGRSYQIGTRNASTHLRLVDGETQILGGLISDQDQNTASMIPGLGHLPVVGHLFGNNNGKDARSEIVLAITPRVVRNVGLSAPDTRTIFSGTANSLRDRPVLSEPVGQLQISGTFGGSTTGGGAPTGVQYPSNIPGGAAMTGPNGGPLINPRPAATPQSVPQSQPTPIISGGLPPPPPMVRRPASAP